MFGATKDRGSGKLKSMNNYTITVEEIASWFRSKDRILETAGVVLAGIHERPGTNKPSVFADFDTDLGIGRISVWVSGESDFEVLRRSDGKHAFLHHEESFAIGAPSLENAFNAFIERMKHPDDKA
jgi:hypothetical protein